MHLVVFGVLTVLCFSQFVDTAPQLIQSGVDRSNTDLWGTLFRFPYPLCPPGKFFLLQFLPRDYETSAAMIKDISNDQHHSPQVLQRVELRDGFGVVTSIACTTRLEDMRESGIAKEATLEVTANREVFIHVIYGSDSYTLLPCNTLSSDDHILLSIEREAHSFFFVVLAVDGDVNISVKNEAGKEITRILVPQYARYLYLSRHSLTGTRLEITGGRVLVLSGMFEGKPNEDVDPDPDSQLLEHVLPVNRHSKTYLVNLPFSNRVSELTFAALADNEPSTITLDRPDHLTETLRDDGTPLVLANVTTNTGCYVLVSGTRPFQLYFLLTCKAGTSVFNNKYFKNYDFGVHAIVSVAPVQQYLADPCFSYHRVTKARKLTITGLTHEEDVAVEIPDIQKTSKVPSSGPIWIRTSSEQALKLGGRILNAAKHLSLSFPRVWYHDYVVVKLRNKAYYLDGPANLFKTNCNKTSVAPGDGIDNDCDEMVDEEIKNGKGDDRDKLIDEDYGRPVAPCKERKSVFFWEPNRYRLTKFEAQAQDSNLANRMTDNANTMVYVSAAIGLAMVFFFILAIWLIDYVESIIDPHRIVTIF